MGLYVNIFSFSADISIDRRKISTLSLSPIPYQPKKV